jgi:hypothetical protein
MRLRELAEFRHHAITVGLGRGFAAQSAKAIRHCYTFARGGLPADDANGSATAPNQEQATTVYAVFITSLLQRSKAVSPNGSAGRRSTS